MPIDPTPPGRTKFHLIGTDGYPACGRVPPWADRTTDRERVTCKWCLRVVRAEKHAEGA